MRSRAPTSSLQQVRAIAACSASLVDNLHIVQHFIIEAKAMTNSDFALNQSHTLLFLFNASLCSNAESVLTLRPEAAAGGWPEPGRGSSSSSRAAAAAAAAALCAAAALGRSRAASRPAAAAAAAVDAGAAADGAASRRAAAGHAAAAVGAAATAAGHAATARHARGAAGRATAAVAAGAAAGHGRAAAVQHAAASRLHAAAGDAAGHAAAAQCLGPFWSAWCNSHKHLLWGGSGTADTAAAYGADRCPENCIPHSVVRK